MFTCAYCKNIILNNKAKHLQSSRSADAFLLKSLYHVLIEFHSTRKHTNKIRKWIGLCEPNIISTFLKVV